MNRGVSWSKETPTTQRNPQPVHFSGGLKAQVGTVHREAIEPVYHPNFCRLRGDESGKREQQGPQTGQWRIAALERRRQAAFPQHLLPANAAHFIDTGEGSRLPVFVECDGVEAPLPQGAERVIVDLYSRFGSQTVATKPAHRFFDMEPGAVARHRLCQDQAAIDTRRRPHGHHAFPSLARARYTRGHSGKLSIRQIAMDTNEGPMGGGGNHAGAREMFRPFLMRSLSRHRPRTGHGGKTYGRAGESARLLRDRAGQREGHRPARCPQTIASMMALNVALGRIAAVTLVGSGR